MKFITSMAAVTITISGCASSAILVGTARPEISPDKVKIYIRAPKTYEEVALIEASSKASFSASSQGKMDVVVRRLKEEAAKLGANGVLLQGTGDQFAGAVAPSTMFMPASPGAPAIGMGIAVPVMHKAGNGLAIYVQEE